jgi:tetratricopeptide (TPR) repeat protein
LLESETVSAYRERTQDRWLEVCEDWKALASQEPSLHRYILRHYAEHLYERWQSPVPDAQSRYSELCRLALDSDFKQAQTEYLPKEPNLPLKTVQLALDAAIQLEGAPMMARLLIEHAKRAQSEETPLQAWRRGHREREWRREHQERALKMATDIVFQRNHKLGTLWSLLLAWVAESEGERDCAKRFLDEVRKRWEGAKLTELDGWQGEMAAFLLGKLGQVEGAIEVAGLVLGDVSKRELAASWASKELFDQALKVAEGIEDAWRRAEALIAIAGGMAKAGVQDEALWRDALKVAEGIEKAEKRARALREIAGEMAEAGMFDQALKVAEGIEEAWERAGALIAIAGEMAKAGMEDWAKEVFDQALKVAEGIEDAEKRAGALITIAEGMAKAGMFDQALKVAEGIEDAEKRAGALITIAEGMAKAGEVEGAVSIVEREMAVRTEGLPSVLSVLAGQASGGDGRSKEGFLKLLPLCGWSLKFAYKACGLLAWLYPERGEEIAGVIAATGD